MKTAFDIVVGLLEDVSPYDIDDPLEKEEYEEDSKQDYEQVKTELFRLADKIDCEIKLKKAVQLYSDRQSRRSHPDGKFDKAGRWYPDLNERQECCRLIRQPTRAYPYSLMLHCRTALHVSKLCGVSLKALKQALR